MEIKKINEIIAENFFGLKKQVDFGYWESHDWHLNNLDEIDYMKMESGNHNGPSCKRCDYSYCIHCEYEDDEPCYKETIDYTSGYGFLKFLDKIKEEFSIKIESERDYTICTLYKKGYPKELEGDFCFISKDKKLSMSLCLCAIKTLGVEI